MAKRRSTMKTNGQTSEHMQAQAADYYAHCMQAADVNLTGFPQESAINKVSNQKNAKICQRR